LVDGQEWLAVGENRFQTAASPVALVFDPSASPKWMSIQPPGAATPQVLQHVAEFKPTPAQLAAYAGSYVSDEIDPVYRIVAEDGALVLRRLKAKSQKLRPVVEDYFQGINGVMHFQRDPSGKITGFVLNGGRIANFRFRKTESGS
jgi:hypothetical protein